MLAEKGKAFTFFVLSYHVIPEGAERLSGIQKKTKLFWMPGLGVASSGMTYGAIYGFLTYCLVTM